MRMTTIITAIRSTAVVFAIAFLFIYLLSTMLKADYLLMIERLFNTCAVTGIVNTLSLPIKYFRARALYGMLRIGFKKAFLQ